MLNQSDDFLTVDEVCELLKIGHNAAYRMLNTGEMIFQNHNPWASTLDTQSRMLCTQLVFCFVSHLNNTPKPDSSQEPGFVFRGCLFMRQPLLSTSYLLKSSLIIHQSTCFPP